ncbi:MAG TPA: hypothetical protein VFT84_01820 [Gemmatimonadales bacterium]|nr:hypothetical protein [Gemmatimonadales bacterium]
MTKDDEDRVRAIVREEITRALGALAREAEHLDTPYETDHIECVALGAVKHVAEGASYRLNCPHGQYSTWHGASRCDRCGEPETLPANPFEENHDQG